MWNFWKKYMSTESKIKQDAAEAAAPQDQQPIGVEELQIKTLNFQLNNLKNALYICQSEKLKCIEDVATLLGEKKKNEKQIEEMSEEMAEINSMLKDLSQELEKDFQFTDELRLDEKRMAKRIRHLFAAFRNLSQKKILSLKAVRRSEHAAAAAIRIQLTDENIALRAELQRITGIKDTLEKYIADVEKNTQSMPKWTGKRNNVVTIVTERAAEPERVESAQSSSQPVMTSTPARIESDAHSMYISPVTANRSMMIPLENEILTVNPQRVLPRQAREQVDHPNDSTEEHGHLRSLSQPNDTPLGLIKVAAVGRLHVPPIEQESGGAVLTQLPSIISHPTENTQGGNQMQTNTTETVVKTPGKQTSKGPVVILENTKSAPTEVEDAHVSPIPYVLTDSEGEDGSDVENVTVIAAVGHPQTPNQKESAEVVVVPAVSTPMLSRRSHPAEETQAGKEGAQESRIKNPLKKKKTTKAASKKKKPVLKKSKKPVLVPKKTKSAPIEVEDNHVSRIQNVFTDSEDEDGSNGENVTAVTVVGRPQTPPNQEESEVVGAPAVSSPLQSRRSHPTEETQAGKESAHQESRITTPLKKTTKAASKKMNPVVLLTRLDMSGGAAAVGGPQTPEQEESNVVVTTAVETSALQEEIKQYKILVNCSVCKERRKDAVLRGCHHVFCKKCLLESIKYRERWCPTCASRFGMSDIQEISLS